MPQTRSNRVAPPAPAPAKAPNAATDVLKTGQDNTRNMTKMILKNMMLVSAFLYFFVWPYVRDAMYPKEEDPEAQENQETEVAQ